MPVRAQRADGVVADDVRTVQSPRLRWRPGDAWAEFADVFHRTRGAYLENKAQISGKHFENVTPTSFLTPVQ
jgi:trehalose-6-phosphatase